MIWLKYLVPLLLWTCCTAADDACNRLPPGINFGKPVSMAGVIGRSEATFECNHGYIMEGSSSVTCTGGVWGALPKCLAPCTVTKEQLEVKHLNFHPYGEHSRVFEHNTTVQFTCKERNKRMSPWSRTCIDGHIELPSCTEVCDHEMPEVDFGSIVGIEAVPGRKTVHFQCSPGYVMEGSESVTCSAEQWEPLPKCLAPCIITQEQLKANHILFPDHQDHSQQLEHNTSVEFVCAQGYGLVKPLKATCVDGHVDLPECYEETDYESFGRLPTSISEHLKTGIELDAGNI
ncbi:complement factor H-related protein 3-like isoform X2 [Varanus komodoensis]|uniref:complement factor H-related protein 3-like isoform X2 n=1 Tax=Varanus komodoensis TaxID=61221 RepID=UPI001CF78084|nr:complement factor H-related protein 3-like isoform X2 [Varanus komodoensis]